jgi:hypothetical protein
MPIRWFALTVLLLVVSTAEAQDKKPWSILCYAAADNNAAGPVLRFMDGVRQAIDDDPGIDLLLFIDRSDGYSTDAGLLGEDFTGARLYRLRRGSAERLGVASTFRRSRSTPMSRSTPPTRPTSVSSSPGARPSLRPIGTPC